MKKPILTFLSFFFFAAIFFAQKPFFNKKITNNASLVVNQVVPTENDGFLAAGRWIESISPFKVGSVAIKFDKNGTIQWSKTLISPLGLTGFTNVLVLNNGNHLVAYDGSQSRNYLTMLDKSFTPIWTLQVGSPTIPSDFNNFIELGDGNIAAIGYSYNTANGFQIAVLNQTTGATVWVKRYESQDTNISINVSTINETNDGELLVSGSINGIIGASANTPKTKNKLLKIKRLDGAIVWQKEFSSDIDYFEGIQSVSEDNGGNFYLNFYGFINILTPTANYNKAKNGIVKLDKDANIKWFRTYGDTISFLSTLLQKKDGNFLALIDDNWNSQNNGKHYLNINQDGDITSQSQELYPKAPYTKACFTNDGSLITTGYFDDCESATTIYLQKRADNGDGNCSEPSNIKSKSDNIIFSNYFKDIQVKSGVLPKIVANFKVGDYPLNISDENTFCQDTTFIKRCAGDIYAVGNNKYTKDGVYKDTLNIASCDSVILSKLTFFKNDIKPIDTTICTGKSLFFNQKNYDKEGFYKEILKNSLGCDSTISLNLKIQDIAITVSDDVTVSTAEKTILSATSNFSNVQWQWSPSTYLSCTDCPNPTAMPLSSITYKVKVKSKLGCSAEGKVNIDIKVCNQVFIPTTFSPNDDGINDQLTIFTTNCATKVIKYTIYDRWGTMIYERSDFPANDSNFGWNGKFNNESVQKGVYIYKISIEFTDGKIRNYSGDVFLE